MMAQWVSGIPWYSVCHHVMALSTSFHEEEEMEFSAYSEALRSLKVVENPSVEDIVAITPHLSVEQREAALHPPDGGISSYFAVPPVRVRYAFWTVCLETFSGRAPRLGLYDAPHTARSYAHDAPDDVMYGKVLFQDEAIAYAEEHWAEQLIMSNWQDGGLVYLQDPSDLYERDSMFRKRPKTKAVVYYTTDRKLHEIWNDISTPESEIWGSSLVQFTTDHIFGREILGRKHSRHYDFNCAYCSYGLGLSGCDNCGFNFPDDGIRTGWSTPLPEQMVTRLIESGHRFQMDPAIAREREREKWQRNKKLFARHSA
jgi:hypothetical protein